MKKIQTLIIALVICLLFTGCKTQENNKNEEEKIKYILVAYHDDWNNKDENVDELYEYYFIIFDKKTNEVCISYKDKETAETTENFASYIETENQYIVTANSMSWNFVFGNTKDTLIFTALVATMTFERVG